MIGVAGLSMYDFTVFLHVVDIRQPVHAFSVGTDLGLVWETMRSLYAIDPGPDCPELVRMIVEIPKNSRNKYEYDASLDVFRLDRALYSPMHYPGDYGFIPGTLASDGDPMDVLVMVEEPSFAGCLIVVRPVGVLKMIDQQEQDQKILAVPNRTYDMTRSTRSTRFFLMCGAKSSTFSRFIKSLRGA